MTKFFGDLFKNSGNQAWELARFIAAYAVMSYSATFIVPLIRNGAVAFDYSSLGIGFAAILAGAGALIWAKDTARTAALSQVKQDATAAVTAANPPAPATPAKVEVINTPANPVPVEQDERG